MSIPPKYHEIDRRFAQFVDGLHAAVVGTKSVGDLTGEICSRVRHLLLNWAMPDSRYLRMQKGAAYGSYVLYTAPNTEVVVCLDTFAAGQSTQIHNHRTWGVVGVIAGSEMNEVYVPPQNLKGEPSLIDEYEASAGQVISYPETVMHRLSTNADCGSISLHVYGADVGVMQRLRWNSDTKTYCEFRQGWSNDVEQLADYFPVQMLDYTEMRRRAVGYLGADPFLGSRTP